MIQPKSSKVQKQQGTVLVISMIMLASLSMLSLASVDSAILGMHIAKNTEEKMNAFQAAQSAIDLSISDTGNLPMTGAIDSPTNIALTGDPFTTSTDELITASAERTIDCGLPPRLANGTSLLAYSSFSFRMSADVDRTGNGRSYSSIRQGYLILGPKC